MPTIKQRVQYQSIHTRIHETMECDAAPLGLCNTCIWNIENKNDVKRKLRIANEMSQQEEKLREKTDCGR